MKINLFFLFCAFLLTKHPGATSIDNQSIHQIDYYGHMEEAKFSSDSSTVKRYTQLQPRVRGMLKNYYGYLPYWIDTVYYEFLHMELLTHIAYFCVEINAYDGSLGNIPNQDRFSLIRDYAHGHGVRVHMTFIIFGNTSVANFLNNASTRLSAINNISDFMENYGIDGANIDFEFVPATVRDSFTLFINDLSYTLWNHSGGRKELYLATIAVPEWYPGYDIINLAQHSDGLFIMAYDFHWSGSSIAGPVSPCVPSSFWGAYCVAKSIGSYKANGVDGSKIILGLPYYGYDWPTVSGDKGSSTTGPATAVIYYYAFQNANNYGRLWDDHSLTPWYRYYLDQWHQCWFDDSISLDIKYGMVNDSILQGAGCWALGYDRDYEHIWNAIIRNFWDSTGIFEIKPQPLSKMKIDGNVFTDKIRLTKICPEKIYIIRVYDILGREAILLQTTGRKNVGFGKSLTPGVYFLTIESNNQILQEKIIKIY